MLGEKRRGLLVDPGASFGLIGSERLSGGEGSLCPALLSNPALLKQHAAILSSFTNADGVMAILGGDQDAEAGGESGISIVCKPEHGK